MEFRILGQLQVIATGGPVPVGDRRQRALLAALLINRKQPVPIEYLVDAVWDDRPPATARRQIQNFVSALRRALTAAGLPEPAIVKEGSGYQIRLNGAGLDAQRFADQVARAQRQAVDEPADAVAELRSALALWQGPALAGLSGRLIEAAAAGLEEQRLAALEQCLDLELRLGREDRVVGELTELVAAYPLRERLVEQLMLALYRSGRRAEALRAYQRLRALLSEELGLDPGTSLQRLQTAILRADADADAGASGGGASGGSVADPAPGGLARPALLPPDVAGFTGRVDGLRWLENLLPDGGTAGTAVAVISGMAGVGKTTLAVHWAHRVADRFPDGQLYVNLCGFDPSGRAVTPAQAVRGFLDALGVPAERIPADPDAQTDLYRSLLAGRRVLVVLDNARDAGQVRPLLPATPTALTIVTSRDRLTPLVATLGAEPLTLDVLSWAEARHLLTLRLGEARTATAPDAVDEIIAACARLPLALAIAGARARQNSFPLAAIAAELADARQRLDALDAGDQTSQVRAVFSWSYAALDPAAARLFRLLGLLAGPDVSASAAVSLSGVPPEAVKPLLAELSRANLVAEPARDRYTCHDLLRAYAAELADETDREQDRRAALTRLLDHYTHTAYAADLLLNSVRDPIRLALAAPASGVRPEPMADAGQAMAWLAAEHRILLATQGQAADAGFDTLAWQLAWTMDDFLDRRGYWPERTTAWSTALRAAGRIGDPGAQAYAHRLLASTAARLGRHDDADRHARLALDLFGRVEDRVGQADSHRHLAVLRARQGDPSQALPHARQALELYRAAGHERGMATTLNNLGWYHAQIGEYPRALEECGRALALLELLGDRWGQAGAWDSLGYAHHRLGHHSDAHDCYLRSLELLRAAGYRYEEATVLTHLGDAQHATGDHRAAQASWHQAVLILSELQHADADAVRARLEPVDS